MKRTSIAAAFVFAISPLSCALGQTTEGAQQSSSSKGAPMSTPSTTRAPVAAGSTQMHDVATPTEPARTTKTGGNTNGGAN